MTRLSANTDRCIASLTPRSVRKVRTIASPPTSGGSAAATRLRKNHSASRNSSGKASSSAPFRSSDTIRFAAREAAADPPSRTSGVWASSRLRRSTAFGASTEFLRYAVANARRPSREIILADPLGVNGVTTRPMARSEVSLRATCAIWARPCGDPAGARSRISATTCS